MHALGIFLGLLLMLLVLMDGFESVVQPRRVTRQIRIARLYYFTFWGAWEYVARRIGAGKRQSAFLSVFGPLSLLGLFANWVIGLIFGFALLNWGLRCAINIVGGPPNFLAYLYMSGTTFFTLGYGDVTPITILGRSLAVAEAGLGFGFLAAILSYLPTLFQAYSRREVSIALLDARAGSPPSASEFLLRLARAGHMQAVGPFLEEWERWAAELLESQLSFPVLSYYRSQHDNESWLSALTMLLDSCALLMVQVKGVGTYQPQVTFAMARHAAVDLALVLRTPARPPVVERLADPELQTLRRLLTEAGLELHEEVTAAKRLRELRGMYEPFLLALAHRLLLTVPPIMPARESPDNWQRSAWMRPAPGIGSLPLVTGDEEHFA